METKVKFLKSQYGICVLNQEGALLFERNAYTPMEAASTIKFAIVCRALEILKSDQGYDLEVRLTRHLRHRSYGSGVINWTFWRKFTIGDLVYLTLNFSDCVATNLLLEYIGGQNSLNTWLHEAGYATTLLHTKKIYTNRKEQFGKLCTSTPFEMSSIALRLFDAKWPQHVHQLLKESLTNPHIGWIKPFFAQHTAEVYFKTGSIIQTKTNLPFVYDAVGRYSTAENTKYFCLLTQFTPKSVYDEESLLKVAKGRAFAALEQALR